MTRVRSVIACVSVGLGLEQIAPAMAHELNELYQATLERHVAAPAPYATEAALLLDKQGMARHPALLSSLIRCADCVSRS